MTTITIAPHTGAKLKEMAAWEGRDENTLADALLTEALKAVNRDRSWEIYFRLRPQIETPENIGKLILLDLNSGDYEIANDELGFKAVAALRERHPDAHAFGMRIGYKTSASFCGDLERLPE